MIFLQKQLLLGQKINCFKIASTYNKILIELCQIPRELARTFARTRKSLNE